MNNTYSNDSGTPSSDCSLAACRVIGSLPHSATVILDIQGYPNSGQSLHLIERHEKGGLIIPWSQVRVLAGPPSPMEIIELWHWDQGIRVPWSESIGGGFPIVAFMRHRNSIDPIDLAKKIAALSPNDDKKPPYVAEYSALIGLNHHMLLLSIELPSDGTKHASNCAN